MKAMTILKLAVVGSMVAMAVLAVAVGSEWWVPAAMTSAAGVWAKILTQD